MNYTKKNGLLDDIDHLTTRITDWNIIFVILDIFSSVMPGFPLKQIQM